MIPFDIIRKGRGFLIFTLSILKNIVMKKEELAKEIKELLKDCPKYINNTLRVIKINRTAEDFNEDFTDRIVLLRDNFGFDYSDLEPLIKKGIKFEIEIDQIEGEWAYIEVCQYVTRKPTEKEKEERLKQDIIKKRKKASEDIGTYIYSSLLEGKIKFTTYNYHEIRLKFMVDTLYDDIRKDDFTDTAELLIKNFNL